MYRNQLMIYGLIFKVDVENNMIGMILQLGNLKVGAELMVLLMDSH